MADPRPPSAELRRAVVPLGETAPESSPNADAVEMLQEVVEDASLVALGETSHGARAQFRLKHRLIRLLVEEFGIRAFALEEDANWVRQVDRYVTDGAGDIQRLLQRARINWPWKTAELVALFDWMRTFNEDSPTADRIRVYGFDTSSFERIARALSSFFNTVDATVPAVRTKLETLAEADEATAIGVAASLQERLPSLFDDHEAWKARCSSEQFAFARRQMILLSQALELVSADAEDRFAIRDEAMATNASWVVNDASSEQAVLWAHNIHVARAEESGGMPDVPGRTMGDRLASRHGDQYVPIGLGLGGGEYLAMDAETMGPVTPSVPEPPAGSIPDAFSRVDVVTPFVRTAALYEREGTVGWLAGSPRRHRISGMVENGDSLTYVASDLSEFDAFAFVKTTEPTRHLGLDG
jgi:erythromycin esterase